MSTGAVIAAVTWALIVVALIAILGGQARHRRNQARSREARVLRGHARARLPAAARVRYEPAGSGGGDSGAGAETQLSELTELGATPFDAIHSETRG